MSLAFIISLAIQVILIVHCIRTGRNWLWMLAIGLLPIAGSVAYVLVEVLPDLFRRSGTRRAVRGVRRALDPEQDLRRFEAEARITGGVASRQRYADELTRQGRPADAIAVYRQALTGLYESDPNLLLGLAQAQFASGAFADARGTPLPCAVLDKTGTVLPIDVAPFGIEHFDVSRENWRGEFRQWLDAARGRPADPDPVRGPATRRRGLHARRRNAFR